MLTNVKHKKERILDMKQKQKENIFIIALAGLLLIIVFWIAILAFSAEPTLQPEQQIQPTITITLTPTPTHETTSPPVKYDTAAQDKLLDKFNNRQALSSNDTFAKAKILASLPPGQQSGIVYKTSNISIEYVHSPDLFQIEILTTDIAQAKAAANVWFRAQGMSQRGICDLPLLFYLNWEIANQMRGQNIQFSPLGNGC